MGYFNQAPILKSKGEKNRDSKWGKAIRTHELESIIFNGLSGKQGAQLKLMMFLTGNADNGSFAVAEATVQSRCGMSENTYKMARKSLVEKGWIIHNPSQNGVQGSIIVDYDAIYKSAARDNENTSSKTENTPLGNDENTYNNITENINRNNLNQNTIKQTNPRAKVDFMDKDGNFIF